VQWDVDSLDWKNPGQEALIDRVTRKVLPGSIILLHNGTQDTAKALPKLIQKLKADGYTFKPISEFIYKENYTIDHAGKQIKNN
jgi:peptidoglycan/xylan/chitin deacetylase (PgdA/CDA1 family)